MCSHGSEMTEQPVCFVAYSASDFAGSAFTPATQDTLPGNASVSSMLSARKKAHHKKVLADVFCRLASTLFHDPWFGKDPCVFSTGGAIIGQGLPHGIIFADAHR